jgi:hypothetical protein
VKATTLLVGCLLLLGACSQSQAVASAIPSNIIASAAASAVTELADDAEAWCVLHLGGPGADQHQVEDAAIAIGVIPGAKTREDVFGRWGGKAQADLVQDPTYVAACTAAYAQKAVASPSA